MTHVPRRGRGKRRILTWSVVVICGFVTTGLAGADPADRGRIAILHDNLPVDSDGLAEGIASSPEHLATVLRQARFHVTPINAERLGDRAILNRDKVDLLVLPYGPSFPVAAADNLRQFLRDDGKFISLGGYAFDNLLTRTGQGWQPYKPIPPEGPTDARWSFDVPADELRPHGQLTFSGWLRTNVVEGQHFAFMAVYQYGADGKLVEFKDVCQVTGTTPWQKHTYPFRVNSATARVTLHAGMWMCAGQAWFDGIQLLDRSGKVVVDAPAAPGTDADTARPKQWYRSQKAMCSVDTSVRHASKASLGVRLNYAHREERLNTRRGKPMDGLVVRPTQLGVFDPDYRLRRATKVGPAPDQQIFGESWSIDSTSAGGSIQGYAASGVLGFNVARWRPLVNAYDGYGRLRGAAGALLHHYAGAWQGSSWAFFGLTSHDVMAPGRPGADRALVRLAEHLIRDVYLISVLADKACYQQGQAARATTRVFNGGRRLVEVVIRTLIFAEGQSEPSHEHTGTVSIAPGAIGQVACSWSPDRYEHGFYRLRAELRLASHADHVIDVVEGGFVVQDPCVVAAGPKLTFRDNYLHVDGRPMFLFGTDDWIYVFNTTRETPLQWRRDMEKRRDFGVTIYENLQFGLPASPTAQAKLFNQVHGLVQLCQQFRQVYFPCLLCGFDVAVDEATLRKHADFAGAYAKAFAHVPGLIYYLNGDLRCRITKAVQPELAAFLRTRYSSDAKLRTAWGDPNATLTNVAAEEYPETGAAWSDVRAYDTNLFRAYVIRRWHDALIDAIRKHDGIHPTTSEFYQLPYAGVDVPAGIGRLDLSNIGFFEEPLADVRRLPCVLKYSDLRSRGKSFGPGEYGVKTHPAWASPEAFGYHKARTHEQAIDLFLAVAHYALGLGASRIHNWCWKDGSHNIFPWGMVHACDEVEKDTAYVHRNQSLLFRHFRPVYEPPAVYVMTPDTHRLGGQKRTVIEGMLNGIQLALACHVDSLGMLNEHALAIPEAAKVIYLPIPFCLTDAAYGQLLDFVRNGGTLYLSGDVSFDPLRRRTRTRRLSELCGVRFVRQRTEGIDLSKLPDETLEPNDGKRPAIPGARPCIDVEPGTARSVWKCGDSRACVFENHIGRGRVVFAADPIELRTNRSNVGQHAPLYRYVLDAARVRTASIEPDNPHIHVMRVPLQDGGRVLVLFNADESAPQQTVAIRMTGPAIRLTIRRHRPALLWFDGSGRLRAAEVQGDLRIDERLFLRDGTNGIVLSLDGKDLSQSEAIVLMPLQAGVVTLETRAPWQDVVAEVGEVRHGRWRHYAQRRPTRTPSTVSIDVTDEQVFSLTLVCRRTDLARWREAIQRAMTTPFRFASSDRVTDEG